MGDNQPPTGTPPTDTPPPAQNLTKDQFRAWFEELVSEKEQSSQSVHPSGSSEQSSGQSLAQQIEAILTARERRQNNDKRMTDLEASNSDLKKQLDELKKAAGGVKSSVFSIFDYGRK